MVITLIRKMLAFCCFLSWPRTSFAFVPQTLSIHAVCSTSISQRNNFITPPMKSTYQSASEIISSITKTEDLTAIEAIFPFVNRLVLSPVQVRKMMQLASHEHSRFLRMVMFALLGCFVPRIGQYSRNYLSRKPIGTLLQINELESSDNDIYKGTKTYHILNHIKQGFYLGVVNDAIDLFLDSTQALGVSPKLSTILSNACTSTSFSVWAMFRIRFYKNLLLNFILRRMEKSDTVTVQVMKRVTNYLLYIFTGIIILDQIGIQYRIALNGLSVFGGVGALVFGYASKEIATQLLSGALLQVERPFDVGDKIIYGDGKTVGKVEEQELLYTVVKGSDEVRVKIPNSKLNLVSNISRGNTSQVKQSLKFKYAALECMPELISSIKKEIVESCPKLILDGSSPWRVYFNSFELGYVEVVVDARFKVVPSSNEYYKVREAVMNAIGRAVLDCEVEFQDSPV